MEPAVCRGDWLHYVFGEFIIIATMYFGRVGPISLALALGNKGENRNIINEPTEEISIG